MGNHSLCPFCGSKENQTVIDDGIGWVKCNGCGATGPIFSKYSGEEDREYISWESRAEAKAQHSVPEEFIGRLSEFLAQRGATGKALLRELRAMLAAAPGKEVGHE
ncbi:TPA: hypothetical protein ACKQGD_005800 [Pseudomonas aeruginosa]